MAIINTSVNANTKLIDARGPRFGAAITTVVLAVALVTHSTWLVGLQLVVFAIGAIGTPARTPYALIFKKFVRPRLRGEVPTEDVRPPQFAQAVGLAFAVVAFVAGLVGAKSVFVVALSLCLAAAFLNAAFNYCLGCEAYLLIVRLTK
jgi:hypothetical protein